MKVSEIETQSAQLPLSAAKQGHIQVVEWDQETPESSYASETTVSLQQLINGKFTGRGLQGHSYGSVDSQTDGSNLSDDQVTIDNIWKVLKAEK